MNLEKAIEILELNVKEAGSRMPPDTLKALKIGIEALKTIKEMRYESVNDGTTQLPGETEK